MEPDNATFIYDIAVNDNISDIQNVKNRKHEWTESPYSDASKFLSSNVSAGILIFGILGNILTLTVLSRRGMNKNMPNMEKCSQVGLIALSISDLLFCISVLPSSFLESDSPGLNVKRTFHLIYTVYQDAVVNILITCSSLLTVSMATQRYLAICYPMRARQVINFKYTCGIIAGMCVFSIIINIPRFWKDHITVAHCTGIFHSILNCTKGAPIYSRRSGFMKKNVTAKSSFIVVHFILTIIVPFVILVFCNVNLIKALRKSKKLRNQCGNVSSRGSSQDSSTNRITLTLIIIIIMYIILVTPAECVGFIRGFVVPDTRQDLVHRNNFVADIMNTLQKINFSFNFILYVMVNPNFRKQIICCRLPAFLSNNDNSTNSDTASTNRTGCSTMITDTTTVTFNLDTDKTEVHMLDDNEENNTAI